MTRWKLQLFRAVGWLAVLATLACATLAAATQTAWFKDWLRGYVVRMASDQLNGALSIGELRGNLISGIELHAVAVSMNGRRVLSIDNVRASYTLGTLIRQGIVIDDVEVTRPVVAISRDESGSGWDLSRLVRTGSSDQPAQRRTFLIRHVVVSQGSLSITSERTTQLDHIDAALSSLYVPDPFKVTIEHLSFVSPETEIALHQASGAIAFDQGDLVLDRLQIQTDETRLSLEGQVKNYQDKPDLNLKVLADPLSFPELRRLVPEVGTSSLRPRVDLRVSGPVDHAAAEFNLESTAGDIRAEGVAAVNQASWSFLGHLYSRHLDLSAFLDNPAASTEIVANATLDLQGGVPFAVDTVRATVEVDAQRLRVRDYLLEGVKGSARLLGRLINVNARTHFSDADIIAAGTVTIPRTAADPLEFDLHGRATRVDLSHLPSSLNIPSAESDLAGTYQVKGRMAGESGPQISGEATLDTSTIAGATIRKGTEVRFRAGRGDLQYQARATVADVDLAEIGQQFHLEPLTASRFRTRLAGDVTVNVRGSDLEKMELEAEGSLRDSSLFSGNVPNLSFVASLRDNSLAVTARGDIDKVDLAVATDNPELTSSLTGSIYGHLRLADLSRGVTVDSIDVNGTVDLAPSTFGRFVIDHATFTGDYHNSVVDAQSFEGVGSGIRIMGNGTVALNDTDQSGFWIHADATDLEQVGLVDGQPVTGIATLDATISGNRQRFTAKGTLNASSVKYGPYGSLEATSEFSATTDNLDWAQTTITADSRGTFVDLPGLHVNELSARTTYQDKRVAFDLTAAQPQRTLTAAGSVEFRPEDRVIQLERLRFDSQGLTWQTQASREAIITYDPETVGVKDLELVNGDQRIGAEGSFGRSGDKLTLTMTNVDMGIVDVWLLRQPQLGGRLNGSVEATGTRESPNIEATISVVSGRFRDVPYESLDGQVSVDGAGADVNLTLQQNASQWLTVLGYVPLSTFAAQRQPGDQPVDLHVETSDIDLGLVQGLTPALTGVKGTLQARVDLTGTPDDPRAAGTVTVRNGAFKVEPTGVSYTGLDGRIDLLPDRIHIDDLHVLDNQSQQLSASGDFALSGLRLGDVNLYFSAADFKVLDNKMGNLRLNSDLRLTGTLARPKVDGELDVSTGVLNLDPILATLGGGAYSTEPVEATDAGQVKETDSGQAKQTDKEETTGWRATELAVHLVIPDDLVVKANDLKALGTTFGLGLGAVNVTLGGDLNVAASPDKPMTLIGAVNTIRGFYDFQGRRFTILRDGNVRFEGAAINRLDPALDVRAERVIQAVTARVTVRGRLRRPTIDLTSTPPLDKSDILALIVFNQPLNALGTGQQASLTQHAAAMAAGAVTSQLTNSIANALNLNQFEINVAPDWGAAAELVVGQQLAQNVYVRVQQGVGDHRQTNLVLEYEFTKWLRLQTNVVQGADPQQQLFQRVQSTGLDLVFSFTFK
jgi:autotransporter translocation and assembly factor TamB